MTATRDKERPDSYWAILNAATTEFAERGFEGVRMEHVARRAGFNKSLVYRFFKDRETLFREVLRNQFTQRDAGLNELPERLGPVMAWWAKTNRAAPQFGKLILREALADQGEAPVEAEQRTAYYQKQIEMLRAFQKQGALPADLPSEELFLALLGITFLPLALPQICRLVTGEDISSDAFAERWESFLSQFGDALASGQNKPHRNDGS
jgi:AcrR family transcriptional regulator